jgi:predicted SAM-dependent methyltransferase
MNFKMKRLHLGCGTKRIEGFVNVDIRDLPNVDLLDDISKLNNVEENSIDLIYACHVLEHFGRHEYMSVLKRWYDVIKDGGTLRISVPDFEQVVRYYNKHKDISKLIGFLYGGQTYEQNYHYCIWDFKSLQNDLESLGFINVRRYDWRDTEHSDVDDFSQAYLPHMDKENGQLMSLNIECKK